MIRKNFYYFVPSSNPFPFICSLSSFGLFSSCIIFIKYGDSHYFFLNLFNIFLCAFLWWFSYSSDFNFKGEIFYNLEAGIKFAFILFIFSEVFFFFSFFWSYFHFFLSPILDLGYSWPPCFIKMFNFIDIPLLNTLILLRSGVSVTLSHYFLVKGSFLFKVFLFITSFLGFVFSLFQYLEYTNSFFSIRDSSFGARFFMLTGFHGIHVLVGTFFLIFVLFRSFSFCFKVNSFFSFEISSWYWHFVDVVWIFLYFFLYFLGC